MSTSNPYGSNLDESLAGLDEHGCGGKLPALVFVKMKGFMKEYDAVLAADSKKWELWQSLLKDEAEDIIHQWTSTLVSCALECGSELKRRIADLMDDYPAKLAWFIYNQDPHQPCMVRQKLAEEILVCDMEEKDSGFTAKLKEVFSTELQQTSRTGLLDPMIYQMIYELFAILPVDTQMIEGCNSIIKKLVTISPNIHLPLTSDRLLIKKAVASRILQGSTAEIRRDARLDAINYSVEKHAAALQQCLGLPGPCFPILPIERVVSQVGLFVVVLVVRLWVWWAMGHEP